jgi:hypothetical protein
MESRNLNRPSYVLALLLGFVAIVDAANALIGMQIGEICTGLSSSSLVSCGNSGWFVDLLTSGVSAALVALLLMRPHLYVFTAAAAWSFLAFGANFVMRHSPGLDPIATVRMTTHFVVFIVAGVLFIVEGQKWLEAERAKRPVAPALQAMPVWTGAGWVIPYAPPNAQYGAPAAPAAPPAPFGTPWMPPAPAASYGMPAAPQPPYAAAPVAPPAPMSAPVAPPTPDPLAGSDASAPGEASAPAGPTSAAPAEPASGAGDNK